jgi:transposase-like protein
MTQTQAVSPARARQGKPARDAAMRRACLEYGYTMAAVAREAGIHYSTVHRFPH